MSIRQLRNPQAERWDFLSGVLPHGINPTDIDLAYERYGHFLFMEGKRPGQGISRGQEIFFSNLHNPPRINVLRFEGTPPDQVERFGYWGGPMREADANALRAEIRVWFNWVESQRGAA